MGKVAVISKSLGALGKHPILGFAGALGFLFGVDKWLGLIDLWPKIDTIMTDLAGENWLSQAVNSPWFGILSLLIGVICFVRIGILAQREERRQAENILVTEQEIAKRISNLIDDRTRLPTLQAKRDILQSRRDRIQQGLHKVNESKHLYATFIENARSGALSDNRKDELGSKICVALSPLNDARMSLGMALGTKNLQPPILELCVPIASAGLMSVEEHKFDIGRNTYFIDALDRNAAKISNYLEEITIILSEQTAELDKAESGIVDEVSRITNG